MLTVQLFVSVGCMEMNSGRNADMIIIVSVALKITQPGQSAAPAGGRPV